MSEVSEHKLPRGWALARFPELIGKSGLMTDGDWVESKDQDPKGEIRLTQLADIGDGEFKDRSDRYLTRDKAEQLGCTLLEPGDMMIARMPDPLGRACVFPDLRRPCVTVVDVCVVRPGFEGAETRWLMHAINAPASRRAIAALQSGSTRKRISKKNLSTIKLPIPPRPEQSRIVEAIESYFTRLDNAVATLERVRANLKRYRASVLKAAVEGRLVPTEAELARQEGRSYEPASELLKRILAERRRRWEKTELAALKAKGRPPKDDKWKAKYKEPVAPDTSELPDLPEGWCWASLPQLSWDAGYGTSTKCGYEGRGEPVLRIPNIVNQSVDISDLKVSVRSLGIATEKYLDPGDLLIIRTNGSRSLIGRAAIVQRPMDPYCFFASYLIRYRLLGSDTLWRWILAFWHSPDQRRIIEAEAATSAGQYNISLKALDQLLIALPPLEEQERLLLATDRATSLADAGEVAAESSARRSSNLRQSILKWAFEGKLADQDPNDEPASVLLERIKAEREAKAAEVNSKTRMKGNGRKRSAA